METTNNRRASVEALKPIAYRASQGISFEPEKRGEQWMNDCENSLRHYGFRSIEEAEAFLSKKSRER